MVVTAIELTTSIGVDTDSTWQGLLAGKSGIRPLEGDFIGVQIPDLPVRFGGQLLSVRGLAGDHTDLFVPLHGAHQAHNVALAVAAVEAFLGGGEQSLSDDVLRAALTDVSSPGRLEIVRRSPIVLVDAAHNPHGAAALATALTEEFTFSRVVGVVAMFEDKDVEGMLEALQPALDHVVCTRSTSPRCLDPERLGRIAEEVFGPDRVDVRESLADAVDRAAEIAEAGAERATVITFDSQGGIRQPMTADKALLRSAIESIPRGQWEAAQTIGMSRTTALRRIILPQAARTAIPPLSNTLVSLLKDTSLTSIILVVELTQTARFAAAPTFQYMPMFALAALYYWIICTVLSLVQDRAEERFSRYVAA